jgi:hypothetical protein
MAGRDLTCTYCSKQFEGTRHQIKKVEDSGGTRPVCCSPECVRTHRIKVATKPDTARILNCSQCGNDFHGSVHQVHKFRAAGGDKKVCCSPECLTTHRRAVATQMHKDGLLDWGSPAQIEQAKRLGASTPKGEAARNWKGGKHTMAMRIAMRERGEQARAYRTSIQPTCARCSVTFIANRMQRHKWNKYGAEAVYFCRACCATPAYHLYKMKQGRVYEDEVAYYADATCSGCETIFHPNVMQRTYRDKKPDADLYCTNECRMQHMPQGPTSSGWKHGGDSKVVKEVRKLQREIKEFINEGARA